VVAAFSRQRVRILFLCRQWRQNGTDGHVHRLTARIASLGFVSKQGTDDHSAAYRLEVLDAVFTKGNTRLDKHKHKRAIERWRA